MFVLHRVEVTFEISVLEHGLEPIVPEHLGHIGPLFLAQEFVDELLVNLDPIGVHYFLDLDALTLLVQTGLDLLLAEFVVREWVRHRYQLLVRA